MTTDKKTGGEIETGDLKKVQRGDTKYATLTAALAEADNGDTITFLVDYDAANDQIAAGNNYNRFPITKSLIIDGNNHNLTVIGRGLAPGMGATSNVDITFKDINIRNSTNGARCIDTRGNIGTLTLDNAKLDVTGATSTYPNNVTQPLTIGGPISSIANVVIKNGSSIMTNVDATAYYAIITFNPVNMTITNSSVMGWAALYFKAADGSAGSNGSTVTIDHSTITSNNIYNGVSNAFAAFVFGDSNISVDITNSSININDSSDQLQGIASFEGTTNNTLNLGDDNTVTLNGDNAVLAFNVPTTSKLSITGGTFNVDPTDFCAPGYAATQSGNVWTVTKLNTPVAIGSVGYETLDAAVTAATAGQTVTILQAGEYVIPAIEKNLTIEASVNGVVVEHTTNDAITTIASEKTATFKNITFNLGDTQKATAHGFGTLNGNNGALVMDGCTVNGALNLFGVSTFTNCTFAVSGTDKYNIWAVNDNASFTDCSFTNTTRAVNVYDQKHGTVTKNVSFTNCTFAATTKKKAAINVHHFPDYGKGQTVGAKFAVSINNCTTTGTWASSTADTGEAETTICNSTLWMISDIKDWAEGDITVSVDGVAQDLTWGAAKIGNVCYATLAEAFAAANATTGATITLLKDCETGSDYTITNPLKISGASTTLDLNGKTLTVTNNFSFCVTASNVKVQNGTLASGVNNAKTTKVNSYILVIGGIAKNDTISGVTIENVTTTGGGISAGGSEDCEVKGIAANTTIKNCTVLSGDYYAVCSQNESNLTIDGGTYTANTAYGCTTSKVLQASFKGTDGPEGTISVVDGMFYGAINDSNANLISITGGTFDADPSAYVAPGYQATQSGTTWTVDVKPQTGYNGEALPAAPTKNGSVWNVTAANAQYVLDGAYGSIDGKTINFTENITTTLEFGRPTKYPASNTKYYRAAFGTEERTLDFMIENNGKVVDGNYSCYYTRTIKNVKFTANTGVTVSGFKANAGGHVNGIGTTDYVLDYTRETAGSTYFFGTEINGVTFEGITFTDKVDCFVTPLENSIGKLQNFTFKNCTFNINNLTSGHQGIRYYCEGENYCATDLVVDGCTFNSAYQGIYTGSVKNIEVTGSTFNTTAHNAIAIQSQNECNHGTVVITNNTGTNIGDRALRFNNVGSDTQITITGNSFSIAEGKSEEWVKATSLATGITYNISGNTWVGFKAAANSEFNQE